MATQKSPDAFRTISEVAEWLGVSAHVLRFWESKFTQVKPTKRRGGRRYYRVSDMELLGGIRQLLYEDGLTIKGAQKVLREKGVKAVAALSPPVDGAERTQDSTAAPTPDTATPLAAPPHPVDALSGPGPDIAEETPPVATEAEDEAQPHTAPTTAPTTAPPTAPPSGPEIAPLPGDADLPLAEALSRLAPGQVASADIADLLARARSLRDRMDRPVA